MARGGPRIVLIVAKVMGFMAPSKKLAHASPLSRVFGIDEGIRSLLVPESEQEGLRPDRVDAQGAKLETHLQVMTACLAGNLDGIVVSLRVLEPPVGLPVTTSGTASADGDAWIVEGCTEVKISCVEVGRVRERTPCTYQEWHTAPARHSRRRWRYSCS